MRHGGEGDGAFDVVAALDGSKYEVGAACVKGGDYAGIGEVGHNNDESKVLLLGDRLGIESVCSIFNNSNGGTVTIKYGIPTLWFVRRIAKEIVTLAPHFRAGATTASPTPEVATGERTLRNETFDDVTEYRFVKAIATQGVAL